MRLLSIPRLEWLHLSENARGCLRALDIFVTRRKARSALAKLDDHMLRDIGLTRAAAETEAEKPFWRG